MTELALNGSDLLLSRVIFGCMALGPKARDPKRRIATLHAALDAGITSFDTAPLYDFGASEALLGEAMADRRQRVQLLTKVGLRWDDPTEHGEVLFRFHDEHGRERAVRKDSRPESIRLEVERSLRRLRTDVIDLVQVHHPDPRVPIADTMGALADLRREGKLRAIGVSNYDAEQLAEAQRALGKAGVVSNQIHYSLLERGCEREVLPAARAHQVSVLAYSALAQGLLSGTLRRRWLALDDGRRHDPWFFSANLTPIRRSIEAALVPVARAHGASVAQVALAWLLAQPGVGAVIVGATRPAQVAENVGVSRLRLTPEELALIDRTFAELRLSRDAQPGKLEALSLRACARGGRLLDRARTLRAWVGERLPLANLRG